MKKALTILLAVAMMFCFSATAFAADFNDTDKCSDVAQDAINKVAALGIVEGYEDGGFHPTATITRAEFAKMADIAAGLEDSAKQLEDAASSFSDVKAGAWYTGWINLASAQGYVKGYENGTYGPNNTITYAEVVTVLLRLLGYNDNLTGPWPINYINQANKLGILDDVENFSANAPATRADVAIMLAAALDENVVVWDKDVDKFVDDTKKVNGEEVTYTLLEDSFDGKTVQDYVDDVNVIDPEAFEYQISIGNDDFDADADTAVAGAEIYELVGRQVTIIYDKDDYAAYVQVDDEIIEVAEAEQGSTDKKVKLDGKVYTLADGFTFDAADEFDDSDCNKTGYAVINDDNEVTDVFTDEDYNTVTDYFGWIELVTDVDTDDVVITTSDYGSTYEYDADLDEAILIKNGERIEAKDVKAGDVIVAFGCSFVNDDELKICGVVANPSITGKVTDYDVDADDDVTMVEIDGTEYAVDGDETAFDSDYEDATADWEDLYDDKAEVAIYVGTDNVVAYVINDNDAAADEDYAILLDVLKSSASSTYGSDEYKAVIFTADGETKEIALAKGVYAEDVQNLDKGVAVTYTLNDDDEIATMDKATNLLVNEQGANVTNLKVEDNKVTMPDGKVRRIASDAVIFNVEDEYVASKLDKATVLADDITAKGVKADADDEEIELPAYIVVHVDNDTKEIDFMAITNYNASTSAEYGVVTAKSANTITIDGKKYDLDCTPKDGVAKDVLVTYELTGGKVSSVAPANVEDVDGTVASYGDAQITMDTDETLDMADECIYFYLDRDGKYVKSTESNVLAKDRHIKVVKVDGDVEVVIWDKYFTVEK